jgi:hypothetical protein
VKLVPFPCVLFAIYNVFDGTTAGPSTRTMIAFAIIALGRDDNV